MKHLRIFWKFTRPHRAALVWGVACIAVAQALGAVLPRLIQHAVETIQRGATARDLAGVAGLLVVLTAVRGVFQFAMRRVIVGASRRIEFDLRNDFFAHLQKLPRSFYLARRTGDLISRATNDLEGVRILLGAGILNGANTLFLLVFSLIGMLTVSPRLTLVALAPLGLLSFFVRRFGQRNHRLSQEVQDRLGDLSTFVQENVSGIRVVKAYTREGSEQERFNRLNEQYYASNLALARATGLSAAGMAFCAEMGVLATLGVCGAEMMAGRLGVGDFVAFTAYQFMLVWPMMALGWIINLWQRGVVSLERILDVRELLPEIRTAEGAPRRPAVEGRVEFRNLTFTYPGAPVPALAGVETAAAAGRMIGIVGRTGAGKSTLVQLVPRLFEPPAGMVFVDGVDVRDWPVEDLRAGIGYVPQDAFLFSQTLRENIAFGRPEAVIDEIVEAAVRSGLSADVEAFPDRYEQLIGERGVTLSGGQKQRTAMARATHVKPKILLFDDAFSSVDTHTEAEIWGRLKPFLAGRTTLVVAHRISTVQAADEIWVFDGGHLVARGTHAELISRSGLYADLHRQQQLEEEVEAL